MAEVRLSPLERRIAHAIFAAVFPSGRYGDLTLGASDVDMDTFIDDVIATYPPDMSIGIKALLHLIDWGAYLTTASSITALPRDEAAKVFNRFYESRIYLLRQAATTLKTLGALGYLGFPEVQAQLGYVKKRAVPPAEPVKFTMHQSARRSEAS